MRAMKRALTLLSVIAGLLLSTGCSPLSLQRPRLEAVKNVAVIGYQVEVNLQDPNRSQNSNGVAGLVNAANTINDMNSGKMQEKRDAQAVGTYDILLARIAEGTGWNIIQREQIGAIPEYQQALANHKVALRQFSGQFGAGRIVPGVLTHTGASSMSEQERGQLMDALKVDAVVMVRVQIVRGKSTGFAIGGIGKTGVLPKAVLDVAAYDRQGGDPIWHDRYAAGDSASTGIDNTMGVIDDEQLTQGMEEAVESAGRVLMQRYANGG